jgi:nitrate/TMAO reductase-like tetraheme cytochrome c subunit
MRLIRKNKAALLLAGAGTVSALVGVGGWGYLANAAVPEMPVSHLLFATSTHCIACHSDIHAPGGEDISIGWQWRATMMANASRDPYWHAGIRREVMDHPAAQSAIEDKCSTCHMPMQRSQAQAEGSSGQVFRYLDSIRSGGATAEPGAILANAADVKATLAADGVSCTVCHQIRPENFGQESSLDGGYLIDRQKQPEQRELFGRFEIDKGRTRAMHSATGFTPAQSDHLQRSELCASCHTLLTQAFDDQGRPAGSLPEQVPYQEWEHSAYVETNSCQSCHMPAVAGEAPITSVLAKGRPDVRQHVFVGGNSFMLRIFKDHREELGVVATANELEAAAQRTDEFLATATANVEVRNTRRTAGGVDFDVVVTNKAGHKLPTAYPSRRAWLHVVIRDANGAVVFESGAPRADGAIAGNDNDEDGARFEPHYTRVTSADQVQIYESIMGNFAGRVTTGLLFGTRYLKDNRLLPRGFVKQTASEDVAVRGPAADDADFTGGADSVSYSLTLSDSTSPLTVTAQLYFQSIGFRWAQNLRAYNAPEPQRFVRYYDEQAQRSSKLLATSSASAN